MERLKPYPAYRDSGIPWLGKIPKHWEVRKLKFIADVCPSNVNKKTDDGEASVRLCNYVDVYYNERITSAIDFMQASATPEECEKFQLRAGDVCVTKDSEEWNDIAVPALVAEDIPDLLCGYHLAMARPKKDRLTGAYLARAFGARGINEQFQVEAVGVTRYGLSQYALINGVFPLPPLDEQRAMAEFLDREIAKLDALVTKKEQLIALLLERRSALISHAVTKGLNPDAPMRDSGIPWLGCVPVSWSVKRLGGVARLQRGFDLRTEDHKDGVYPVISSSGICVYHTVAMTKAPGVVTGRYGTVGEIFYIEQDFWAMNTALYVREFYGNIPRFIYYLLKILPFDAFQGKSAVPGIDRNDLHTLLVVEPSTKEQRAIADHLDRETGKIDALIARVRDGIEALSEYRTALISAVVTGRIAVDASASH